MTSSGWRIFFHTHELTSASAQRWLRADGLEERAMNKIFVTPLPPPLSEKVRADLLSHKGRWRKENKKRMREAVV